VSVFGLLIQAEKTKTFLKRTANREGDGYALLSIHISFCESNDLHLDHALASTRADLSDLGIRSPKKSNQEARKPGIEEKGNSKSYKAAVVASGNKAADPFDMLRAGSAAATTMMEIHAS